MPRDDVLRAALRDDKFRALPASARALFAEMLILGPTSSAGVLPLMPAKWAAGSLDTTERSAMEDLALLSAVDRVVVDLKTFEVLIRNFIRDCGVWRNPNHFRGALNSAQDVASPFLRQCLALELRRIGGPLVLEAVEVLTADMDSDNREDAPEMERQGIDDVSAPGSEPNSVRPSGDSSEVP
ncbi:hypothetical protein AB0H76_15130 [Nocardia sp. NPDC050712]|uniref:hypothetical protein n=1 Tax=Nocardia sp. NPDC050712 TaxID=3155518 RepID=UPI0033FA1242